MGLRSRGRHLPALGVLVLLPVLDGRAGTAEYLREGALANPRRKL
jgi:hypothetical protein